MTPGSLAGGACTGLQGPKPRAWWVGVARIWEGVVPSPPPHRYGPAWPPFLLGGPTELTPKVANAIRVAPGLGGTLQSRDTKSLWKQDVARKGRAK